jgi:hypothetical protein
MKSMKNLMLASVALVAALALAPAPAKAQVANNADTVVIQLGGAIGQAASAVGNAQSNGGAAGVDNVGANLVNTADITNSISTTSMHLGSFSGVNNNVLNVVGQVGLVGGQVAQVTGNALAAGNANVKGVGANVVNSASVGTNISVNTSRN